MPRDDSEYPTLGEKPKEDRYFIFGSKTNTPLESVVVEKIRDYALTHDLETGAVIALLYLTASRLEEICPYSYKGIAKEDINLTYASLTLGDITMQEKEDGTIWLIIKTRVEKQFSPKSNMTLDERRKMLEGMGTKVMRIPLDEYHPLYPLLEVVTLRIEKMTAPFADVNEFNNNARANSKVPIYTKTSQNIKHRLRKYFNIHAHLLRHWRCKHLTELYGLSTSELTKLMDWIGGPSMAMVYTEASESQLDEKQMRRVNERKQEA